MSAARSARLATSCSCARVLGSWSPKTATFFAMVSAIVRSRVVLCLASRRDDVHFDVVAPVLGDFNLHVAKQPDDLRVGPGVLRQRERAKNPALSQRENRQQLIGQVDADR